MEMRDYLSIRRAYNLVRQRVDSARRVNFSEFAILCRLSLTDRRMRTSDIAEYQGCLRPTMTHRTKHLAELGLISREKGETDRRNVVCVLTEAGHAEVKELCDKLEENGAEVSFAIHPVAGRMPGHMNVLLAEANVPYEQLKTADEMNPMMSNTDVAIVIGANDVVNPSAISDETSPLYGMPIINAFEARTVFVLKRGKGAGFSGVENPLFTNDNTVMIYGDAKQTVSQLVSEFAEE